MTDEPLLSDTNKIKKKHLIGPLTEGHKLAEDCSRCGEEITEEQEFYFLETFYYGNRELCKKCCTTLMM